jgi:hypothetical protein
MLVDMLDRDDSTSDDEGVRWDNPTGDVIYRLSSVLSSIAGKDRQCEVSITHFATDECFTSWPSRRSLYVQHHSYLGSAA